VMHAYNSTTWEVEAGGLTVQCQTRLHSESLSQNQTNQRNLRKTKIENRQASQALG
jgi:hypothetical protein